MPQQINLFSPILQRPQQPFSANTMAAALAAWVLLGGGLCATWVVNLQKSTQGLLETVQAQTQELQSLQASIERSRASAQPPSLALVKEAQDKRAEIESKERILSALQQGRWQPGYGHSDRLELVARSIPAPVWITEIKADSTRMEVTGFTLEPSALNDWVSRMSASPLMQGLRLATVKVKNTALTRAGAPVAGQVLGSAGLETSGVEAWSFSLVSAQGPLADTPALGGKP